MSEPRPSRSGLFNRFLTVAGERLGEIHNPPTLFDGFRNGATTRYTDLLDGCLRIDSGQDKEANRCQCRSTDALTAVNSQVLAVCKSFREFRQKVREGFSGRRNPSICNGVGEELDVICLA